VALTNHKFLLAFLPDEPPTRIPNLAHALLFLAITGLFLFLTQLLILGLTHPAAIGNKAAAISSIPPKLLIGTEALTYLLTLAVSWFTFPLLWRRPFTTGIEAPKVSARLVERFLRTVG